MPVTPISRVIPSARNPGAFAALALSLLLPLGLPVGLALAGAVVGGCGPKIAMGPRNSDGKASAEIRMERARNDPSRKGVQLAEAGDFKGAASAFREAVRLAPEDDNAYFNLGLMLEKTGDYRAARDAYRRASEIDNRSKYREAQVRSQGLLLAAGRRDSDAAVARNPVKIRDVINNKPDNGGRVADGRNGPARGGPNERIFPKDLKLDGDAVPPDPETALRLPAKPRKPLPADGDGKGPKLVGEADPLVPPIGVPTNPPGGDAKPPVGAPAGREPPVVPQPQPQPRRGQPRVLVVQAGAAGDKPDELAAAAGQAAAEVQWHLLQLGGVLLVDRAGIAEEPAAALKSLDAKASVGRLAQIGRDAGADILVIVTARVTAEVDLPDRLNGEVKSRIVRCDVSRELDGQAATDSAAGDRRDATARLVVGQACEQLAKKLPALVAADWKLEK